MCVCVSAKNRALENKRLENKPDMAIHLLASPTQAIPTNDERVFFPAGWCHSTYLRVEREHSSILRLDSELARDRTINTGSNTRNGTSDPGE